MIEKLKTNSRATEVDDASVRMSGAFKKTVLNVDAHLVNIFDSLGIVTPQLKAAIKRMKTESVLEEKDDIRDNACRSLFFLVQGLAHHPDPAIKTAAERVNVVLDNYGLSTITGQSYASESSLVSSMLGDLANPKYQTSIAALSGCAELITALQVAEDDFEATRITYEEEKAQEGTQENATALKKKVVSVINDQLVVYLRAMIQVDEAAYGDFTRTIAQIINENNEVVKRRTKKAEPVE